MNIETANRLLQYRKKFGLSQEELAEKIGVSRQAVSKWERAEASPDTDNLIILANIYGVTLDDLLTGNPDDIANNKEKENSQQQTENEKAETAENQSEENSDDADFRDKDKTTVSFKNGIHVNDGKDKVDISFKDGIHVDSKDGTKVHIDSNGINVIDNKGEQKAYTAEDGHIHICDDRKINSKTYKFFKKFPYWVLSVIGFVVFGTANICGGWATSWLWFLTIPLYYTTVDAIFKKKLSHFCYPVFVAMVYIFLGMNFSLWHPLWVLFITIPFFYFIAEFFDSKGVDENENLDQDFYDVTEKKHKGRRKGGVIVGIIVTVITLFVILGFTVYLASDDVVYDKTYRLNESNTDNLTVDISSGDVDFYRSTRPYSYIEYHRESRGLFVPDRKGLNIKEELGSTSIEEKSFTVFGIGYRDIDIKVYLTDKIYDSITVDTASGNIESHCDMDIDKLTFDISSGDINFRKNIQCKSTNIDISSGSVRCSDIKSDYVLVDISSGNVSLDGEITKADLEASSGTITVNNKIMPDNVKVDISSGDIVLGLPDSEDGFTLNYDKSSGDITSDFDLYKKATDDIDDDEGTLISGKGKSKITVDISSGDVKINKLK